MKNSSRTCWKRATLRKIRLHHILFVGVCFSFAAFLSQARALSPKIPWDWDWNCHSEQYELLIQAKQTMTSDLSFSEGVTHGTQGNVLLINLKRRSEAYLFGSANEVEKVKQWWQATRPGKALKVYPDEVLAAEDENGNYSISIIRLFSSYIPEIQTQIRFDHEDPRRLAVGYFSVPDDAGDANYTSATIHFSETENPLNCSL